jgi:tRNA-splicing ligase RtcB (3'-phosphate/5'-hydroxy nucleic acid ligase)
MTITGQTLLDLGYKPGSWFKPAIAAAEQVRASGGDESAIRAAIEARMPPPTIPLKAFGSLPYVMNIRAENADEADNIASVEKHMVQLMRLPTVKAGAVMPDACSASGQIGTIPVGGIVAAENAIHPGMHSADICCSMAVTMFGSETDPTRIMDAGMTLSHFGGGGRASGAQLQPSADLLARFEANSFLRPHLYAATEHFGTQGDGNHFFYVGRVASSGRLALVTHHGSRKPGAMLYKAGMAAAERTRQRISPDTPEHNAWLIADSAEGAAYWEALQLIRAWTKASHYAIHDLVAGAIGLKVEDRFWNEHNFVFQRADGLFYHAKGATPAFPDYASDATGLTLIPLNMAEPILIARGLNAANGLGFAPHGAGRNFSRSAYMRRHAGRTEADMIAEQAPGVDVRFFCGVPDMSELPGAYKPAATVRAQIAEYGLADIVDTIQPLGSIMAGDWQKDAPWRNKQPKVVAMNSSGSEAS